LKMRLCQSNLSTGKLVPIAETIKVN
jgi:hypothetical protein